MQIVGGSIVNLVVLDSPGEPGAWIVFLSAEPEGDSKSLIKPEDGGRGIGIAFILGLGGKTGGQYVAEFIYGVDKAADLVFAVFREPNEQTEVIQEVELHFFVGKGEIINSETAFGEDTGEKELRVVDKAEIKGMEAGGNFPALPFEEVEKGKIVEEG
ncbi:hypothetical protein MASR1M36_08670 [Candidatus Cloacimonadaceae bacterium]